MTFNPNDAPHGYIAAYNARCNDAPYTPVTSSSEWCIGCAFINHFGKCGKPVEDPTSCSALTRTDKTDVIFIPKPATDPSSRSLTMTTLTHSFSNKLSATLKAKLDTASAYQTFDLEVSTFRQPIYSLLTAIADDLKTVAEVRVTPYDNLNYVEFKVFTDTFTRTFTILFNNRFTNDLNGNALARIASGELSPSPAFPVEIKRYGLATTQADTVEGLEACLHKML